MDSLNRLVKFFREYPLQTPSKRRSFEIFATILKMMNRKEHLTKEGLNKIAKLISEMNRQPKMRYLESSETIRQTQDSSCFAKI